ncbi:angiopoietin-related protein 4 isoform X2 [Phascolarctos cinereus]|uniref:Angiopoietin-related protein 4 isoform X2 n=1 Tax=Phascolarctos cinereus TaxID=38626 RepID=A0A6P5JS50_PHACI|nr:angiopoietin-related protein 4 isoform X2 [Phascolarctos cinereus]
MRCAPSTGAALVLCAATAGLLGAAAASRSEVRPGAPELRVPRAGPDAKYASWDEVNVIAHGLLQLGHGLREHVERTQGQVNDIYRRLQARDPACEDPLRRACHSPEGTQLQSPEESPVELAAQGTDSHLEPKEVAQQKTELQHLEVDDGQRVKTSTGGAVWRAVHSLQTQLRAQNSRIEELFQKVAQQQQHLEKQNLKIQTLQSKLQGLTPLQLGQIPLRPMGKKNALKMARHIHPVPNSSDKPKLPQDCHQLFLGGERQSGLFQIQPQGSSPFLVNCKMTPEGGWTVIQRRLNGSVDFHQPWEAYKSGFGDPNGEFWLGLEKVHHITGDRGSRLAVQLLDWEGNAQSVQIPFHLGGEDTAYSLKLTGPVAGELGPATEDGLSLPFSTWDRDHDLRTDLNCAENLSGGWWFSTCGHSNLNGKYFHSLPRQRHQRKQGIFWKTWRGRYYPLQATTMLIQPTEDTTS